MRKGIVEVLILLLLRDEELYGYLIVQRLKEAGHVVAGEGTVYPVLRRLEAGALVSARWSTTEGSNPRKYYAITGAGRVFLDQALAEWDALTRSMEGLRGAH